MKIQLPRFFFLALLLVTSCGTENDDLTSQDIIKSNTPFFNFGDSDSQAYVISSESDTVLRGMGGTRITIEAGTFMDANGNEAKGDIKIELKECLDKYSMVSEGLTTLSNGKLLESGGMIYVDAKMNNQQLTIRAEKSIGIEIPQESILDDMQFFTGEINGNSINWVNPEPLMNSESDSPTAEQKSDSVEVSYITDTIYKKHNIAYNVDVDGERVVGDEIPKSVTSKISDLAFADNGLIITKDSMVIIEGYKVYLYKREINTWKDYQYGTKWVEKGTVNTFQEDRASSYIFSMKKLGWANIDRFFNDSRTKEIEWLASINKIERYTSTYASMVFDNQNIYLPGYIRKDGSFSFTHGDYEKTALPIGETATVLITAYKDETPYYAIKKVKIAKKNDFSLDLAQTTKAELKKLLKAKL